MVKLTDRPDMTLDVYRGRKTTIQQLLLLLTLYNFQPNMLRWSSGPCLRNSVLETIYVIAY